LLYPEIEVAMKFLCFAILAVTGFGQDRNFPGALTNPLPPLRPIPSLTGTAPPTGMNNAPLSFWGGNSYLYSPATQSSAPNIIVIQQPGAPPLPATPPAPIRSAIQEVKLPAAESATPAVFAVAIKGGKRVYASAVWVQGNTLHYVDTEDDATHRVPLSQVDRAATRDLNNARNLNLRLPASQ
jgi:hypothetical protein